MNNLPLGGFNYDNCLRNKALEANLKPEKQLKFTKTGTTICGVVFAVSEVAECAYILNTERITRHFIQDGVCLAADTRATGGSIVGDKNCEKIHNLAPNIYCCGAGTAADCDHVTGKFKEKVTCRIYMIPQKI